MVFRLRSDRIRDTGTKKRQFEAQEPENLPMPGVHQEEENAADIVYCIESPHHCPAARFWAFFADCFSVAA